PVACVAIVQLLGLEHQRDHQFPHPAVENARRKYADYGVRLPVDLHWLADDLSIRTQPLPQSMRENHHVSFAWLPLFGEKRTAQEKRIAQHLEVARRSIHAVQEFRPILRSDIDI